MGAFSPPPAPDPYRTKGIPSVLGGHFRSQTQKVACVISWHFHIFPLICVNSLGGAASRPRSEVVTCVPRARRVLVPDTYIASRRVLVHPSDVHPFFDFSPPTIAIPPLKRGRDGIPKIDFPSRPRFKGGIAIVGGPKSKKGWTSLGCAGGGPEPESIPATSIPFWTSARRRSLYPL